MRTYYQTTPLTAKQLVEAFTRAGKQDELVLAVLRYGYSGEMTPSQVHARGVDLGKRWLLTSVRRSMTRLTEAGVLVKTDLSRTGPHGGREGCWRLAEGATGA